MLFLRVSTTHLYYDLPQNHGLSNVWLESIRAWGGDGLVFEGSSTPNPQPKPASRKATSKKPNLNLGFRVKASEA